MRTVTLSRPDTSILISATRSLTDDSAYSHKEADEGQKLARKLITAMFDSDDGVDVRCVTAWPSRSRSSSTTTTERNSHATVRFGSSDNAVVLSFDDIKDIVTTLLQYTRPQKIIDWEKISGIVDDILITMSNAIPRDDDARKVVSLPPHANLKAKAKAKTSTSPRKAKRARGTKKTSDDKNNEDGASDETNATTAMKDKARGGEKLCPECQTYQHYARRVCSNIDCQCDIQQAWRQLAELK